MALVKSGGIYTVKRGETTIETVTPTAFFTNLVAATVNQQIIAGVTGKIIRVLSIRIASSNATGSLFLKTASGGAGRGLYNVPAAATNNDIQIPEFENGITETIAGQGLFGDTTGAGFTPFINGMYLIYTSV